MFCPNCKNIISSSDSFCMRCGHKIEAEEIAKQQVELDKEKERSKLKIGMNLLLNIGILFILIGIVALGFYYKYPSNLCNLALFIMVVFAVAIGIVLSNKFTEAFWMTALPISWLYLVVSDVDNYSYNSTYNDYFLSNFTALVLALLVILFLYYNSKRLSEGFPRFFKVVTIFVSYIYILYLLSKYGPANIYNLLGALAAFVIGFLISRIKSSTSDEKGCSVAIYFFGFCQLAASFVKYEAPRELLLMILVQLIGAFIIYDVITRFRKSKGLKIFDIMIFSGYSVIVVVLDILIQTNMDIKGAIVSVIFGILAFLWILLGFKFHSKGTRVAGLILAMFSAAKLLIVDTYDLDMGLKIICYMALGVLLIASSFVFQKALKKDE